MKKKKLKLDVEGKQFLIHEQKKMILGSPKRDNAISFQDFKQMYGPGISDEQAWAGYMKFMEDQGHLNEGEADPDTKRDG